MRERRGEPRDRRRDKQTHTSVINTFVDCNLLLFALCVCVCGGVFAQVAIIGYLINKLYSNIF